MEEHSLWYKNAIFYEVYVRAFCDSNGDGHGDLRGLAEAGLPAGPGHRLPVADAASIPLRCRMTATISPDYYNVLPEYGTLEDLETCWTRRTNAACA